MGCILVFSGCTAMGINLSNRLAERQRILSKLTEVLLNLRNQMCRLGNPLFFAFENIGKDTLAGEWSAILLDCGEIINNQQIDTGEAWRLAIDKNKESMPLEESDWTVISEFGEMLGKSDIQNQESVLDLARENIEILEREARETAKINGKLYRNMGVLSGAAVVILLL
ncbi:MAG: hypothetical protein GX389_04530 [Clostridiaceae bacterium]|nr:hypothetical protein [Clostridiaceae bacterium]